MSDLEKNETNGERITLTDDICVHIFSASAAMVGVCLTVIGIFQIGVLREINSIADNLLAFDASAFLVSCILSYLALRAKKRERRVEIERVADFIFICGLFLMAVICFLIAYELM